MSFYFPDRLPATRFDVIRHYLDPRWFTSREEQARSRSFKRPDDAFRDPNYRGRLTVPVLWDTKTKRIVSNSDVDLLRMFNSEFADAPPGGSQELADQPLA